MINQFYTKALPTEGVYCVADINPTTKRTRHKFIESIDDLVKTIDSLSASTNVFVAMSSFKGHSRKADQASYGRSFFVDLDVGEGKGYESKEDALESLAKFVEANGLPPAITVDSGTGVHAYWFLDKNLPTEEWKVYAEKFKDLCLNNGLAIDPVVTADVARILRSPDTFNYKTNPPTPTKVITWHEEVSTIEDWITILGENETIVDFEDIVNAKVPLSSEQRKALKLDNFQSKFKTIAIKSLKGEGCAQIANIITNAASLDEPLWYAGLSIAQHCSDRDEAIHKISEDHPEYTRQGTERKANQTQDKPQSCITFNNMNPGLCDSCQHFNKITNPLSLGKEFIPAIVPSNTPLVMNGRMVGLPKDLYPFVYGGKEGGIYYEPPQEFDDDGQSLPRKKAILVCKYDLYPVRRVDSPTDGECLEMQVHLPHDPVRNFSMPMKCLYSVNDFRDIITSQGILYNPNSQQGKYLMTYLYAWGDYLITKSKAEIMRQQMGYTEDKKAFIVGDKELTHDGQVLNSPTNPLIRDMVKKLHTLGSYDLWKKAANKLNTPSLELQAFTMLTGLGSILMHRTSTPGVTIALTGADSGSAKTGALRAALSMWGEPEKLGLHTEKGGTTNGMVERYLTLHNIVFGLDEVGNIEGKDLSGLVHKIATGSGKIRMQASVNAEREQKASASLIAILTSNHSLYDKIHQYKKNANGEIARFIEFTVRKPKLFYDNPEAGFEIFDTFNKNYGWAGIDFVKNLYKTSEEVVDRKFAEWSNKFKEDFGHDTTYRYYENLITATFTAAELAIEFGIVSLDLERIYKKTIGDMISIRDNGQRVNDIDYESILGEYINAHQTGILAIDDNRVAMDPRTDLIIRAEIDQAKMYIEKRHFRDYLTKNGVSIGEFVFQMKEKGYKIHDRKKRMGVGWKPTTGLSSITTLEIDTTKFLEDLLKEQNETAQ
ncbi:DUF927 domain-containing protein [Gammaproteobacteria bacterium]|nr:DUF927 domain-containing protein [Gammaproteobacteria bacterium]